MPVEFLSELENKVETLLLSLEEVKDENIILKKTKEQSETRISELESENKDLTQKLETANNSLDTLKTELGGENEELKQQLEGLEKHFKDKLNSLKSDADGQREKINAASERIQGILAKLEAAQ